MGHCHGNFTVESFLSTIFRCSVSPVISYDIQMVICAEDWGKAGLDRDDGM